MMVTYKGVQISRADVLAALADFDDRYPNSNDYDSWLEKGNYRYILRHRGAFYPPKYILHLVTGLPLDEMRSAKQRKRVFEALGFEVVRK